ncbi:MAG: Gfo/Idh/MocA family protein [Spirochaetota bacterium]
MSNAALVGIGVVGCGQRLRTICSHLMRHESLQIVSLYDPNPAQMQRFVDECGISRSVERCESWEAVLENPRVAWVCIGSPNSFHYGQTRAALQAGKHVFLEKPLATTANDCIDLLRLRREHDRRIVTGFVLRYSPLYRSVKQLLQERKFGSMLTIQANENISYAHAAYIMRGWRRKSDVAGPHILEKCIHDIDIMQWMSGSRFSKIAAVGGRSIFSCAHRGLYPPEILASWESKGNLDSSDPFSDDEITIEDHIQLQAEGENGVKTQFTAVAGAAMPERRLSISCVGGSITAELYSGTLRYRTIDMDHEAQLQWFEGGLHGGGDGVLADELQSVMSDDADPAVELKEGVWANIAALAADEARRSAAWIDLRPYWRRADALDQ